MTFQCSFQTMKSATGHSLQPSSLPDSATFFTVRITSFQNKNHVTVRVAERLHVHFLRLIIHQIVNLLYPCLDDDLCTLVAGEVSGVE